MAQFGEKKGYSSSSICFVWPAFSFFSYILSYIDEKESIFVMGVGGRSNFGGRGAGYTPSVGNNDLLLSLGKPNNIHVMLWWRCDLYSDWLSACFEERERIYIYIYSIHSHSAATGSSGGATRRAIRKAINGEGKLHHLHARPRNVLNYQLYCTQHTDIKP